MAIIDSGDTNTDIPLAKKGSNPPKIFLFTI